MQYILSQEEYENLLSRKETDDKKTKQKIQDLCMMVANCMPVDGLGRNGEAKPWGCILCCKVSHVCDMCPVEELCPYEHKRYSQ